MQELQIIGSVVRENGPCVSARTALVELMSTLSSGVAGALYADLMKVQISKDQNTSNPPALTIISDWLDWHDRSLVEQFHRVMIDSGALTSRVADCIELSPYTRRLKWKHEAVENERGARLHREKTNIYKDVSKFRFESRKTNEDAFGRVSEQVSGTTLDHAWKKVIVWSVERIERQSAQFWHGIQVDRCSEDQKRALVHKLARCKGQPAVEKVNELVMQLYARHQGVDIDGKPRPVGVCSRFWRWSHQRLRKACRRVGKEQYRSATSDLRGSLEKV